MWDYKNVISKTLNNLLQRLHGPRSGWRSSGELMVCISMHYFIVCKPEGWFTFAFYHTLMPAGIAFPYGSSAKIGLAILRKKNLLANFSSSYSAQGAIHYRLWGTSVKHYHFLYYLCSKCKLLLQMSLCSTCLASVHLSLLPMTSKTSFLQGWSQTQKQYMN